MDNVRAFPTPRRQLHLTVQQECDQLIAECNGNPFMLAAVMPAVIALQQAELAETERIATEKRSQEHFDEIVATHDRLFPPLVWPEITP